MKERPNFDLEDESNEIEIWRNIFKFFCKKTKINLEIPKFDKDELSDNPEYGLVRKLLEANNDFVEINTNPDELKQKFLTVPTSFGFLDNGHENEESSYGIETFDSVDVLRQWWKHYKSNSITFSNLNSRNFNNQGWQILNEFKHACNSIIICDNYLLSRKFRMYDNLIPILEILLPEKTIDASIDLTIISSQLYNCYSALENKFETPTKHHLKEMKTSIEKELKVRFDKNDINLSIIYKTLSEYHDRHIFTNTFLLKSGNSFTYFDKKGKYIIPSPTTLDICPLQADNNDISYGQEFQPLLNSLGDIVEKASVYQGNKKNRLFNNRIQCKSME